MSAGFQLSAVDKASDQWQKKTFDGCICAQGGHLEQLHVICFMTAC